MPRRPQLAIGRISSVMASLVIEDDHQFKQALQSYRELEKRCVEATWLIVICLPQELETR
jgi:hypothetical protein